MYPGYYYPRVMFLSNREQEVARDLGLHRVREGANLLQVRTFVAVSWE